MVQPSSWFWKPFLHILAKSSSELGLNVSMDHVSSKVVKSVGSRINGPRYEFLFHHFHSCELCQVNYPQSFRIFLGTIGVILLPNSTQRYTRGTIHGLHSAQYPTDNKLSKIFDTIIISIMPLLLLLSKASSFNVG